MNYVDDSEERRAARMHVCEYLVKQGCRVNDHASGVIVNSRFIVAPFTRQWRVKGRMPWYSYSSIEQFYNDYVAAKKKLIPSTIEDSMWSEFLRHAEIEESIKTTRLRLFVNKYISENLRRK